jgi:hypothetical protein
MIQRKQSLWLLLASLCGAGVLFFDLYRGEIRTGDLVEHKILRVSDHYPSLLLALVMVLLPAVTIFMFKNRKRQLRMTVIAILSVSFFMSMMLWRVTNLGKLVPPVTGGSYWIGAIMPIFAMVLLVLAAVGIRKDEKLVRSVDRLR